MRCTILEQYKGRSFLRGRGAAGVFVILMMASGLRAANPEKIEMGPTIDHPHAGITLAVPSEFEYQALSEPYDVMRAVLNSDGKLLRAVTVSAFPVAEGVTAESFADAMTEELKKNLTVRHLKILKKASLPIAGKTGSACTLTYTYRGEQTSAARIYFIRELSAPGSRLCYVLTIESKGSGSDVVSGVIRLLGAVMKPLKLTAVRQPSDIKTDKLSKPHIDHELGFSIRPPVGWYVRPLKDGAVMAQTDYLAGGIPMPNVRVVVTDAPDGATSAAQASDCLAKARKAFPKAEILNQQNVTLVGLEGSQFVLRQKAAEATSQPAQGETESLTLIQNVLCPPAGLDGKARVYMIILVCHGGDIKNLQTTMEKISGSFVLLGRPTTQPTSAPANGPASSPAK